MARATPELSVIIPTFGRPEHLARLLECCAAQTLKPGRFEVIVVDDGSLRPVALDGSKLPFTLILLRQQHRGPSAARNLALDHCSAPVALFLDDDSLLAPDLFQQHLAVHAVRTDQVAVLGSFEFSHDAECAPFVQVLAGTDLYVDYTRLTNGALHPWQHFHTSNLSVSVDAVREEGGFDWQRFPGPLLEGPELGYRLERRGWSVLYRAELVCRHDHAYTAEAYFERIVRLGMHLARMSVKHRDPTILTAYAGPLASERVMRASRSVCETYYPALQDYLGRVRLLEKSARPVRLPLAQLAQLRSHARRLALVPLYRGMLIELDRFDPELVMRDGPAAGRLTTVVVLSRDDAVATQRCLESVRDASDPSHPIEFVVVDQSTAADNAAELALQADVQLVRMPASTSAAAARNAAIVRARGKYIAFLDARAVVAPEWLTRLLYHAEVDPKSGAVAAATHWGAEGYTSEQPFTADPSALAIAARVLAGERHRQHLFHMSLGSSCVLVGRRVLDAIGGFDERFGVEGCDMEDFTLRATLAGFHNRVALDACVLCEDSRPSSGTALADEQRLSAEQFAQKWGMLAGAPSREEERFAAILERRWSAQELYVPVVKANPAGTGAMPGGTSPIPGKRA